MDYRYDFTIAGIKMRWISEFPLLLDERYQVFASQYEGKPEIILELHIGEPDREEVGEHLVFDGRRFQVMEHQEYRCRTFLYRCARTEMVMTLIRRRKTLWIWQLYIPEEAKEVIQQPESLTFYMAFEEMLYRKGRILLHSSYVETKDGAILFTGPSGAGKSTQARLWEQCGDGIIVNGDRTVLYEQDKHIYASGSPCAGTSGIYRNYQSPVRAIIVLEQGEENQLQRLRGRECLIPLIRESNFPYMDEIMKQNQMELLFSVAENIPIYRYQCRKDSGAVRYLQAELAKEID